MIQVLEKISHSFIWQDGYLYFESILKTFGSKHVIKTFVMRYVTRHRYYGVDPVLRSRLGYYRIIEDMTEPVDGREIKVPEISFGVMKKKK